MPEKRKGRVEIVSVRRRDKNTGGTRKEYIVRVFAPNGRQIGSSGESYVRQSHAKKMAFRNAEGRPVYLDGELLEPAEIPIAAG